LSDSRRRRIFTTFVVREDEIIVILAKTPDLLNTLAVLKKIMALYRQYKAYVRVDLVMYAVMILLIVCYVIYTLTVQP
jgi:hypothetical protein